MRRQHTGAVLRLWRGKNVLVAWGVKSVKGGDKNARTLSNVGNLIAQYQPEVIAVEDTRSKGSQRKSRIQALIEQIVRMAQDENIKVKRFSRKRVNLDFLSDEQGTKRALAEYFANRFPEELNLHLPQKHIGWTSNDCRMDIFDAVALAEHFLRSRD